MCGYRRCSNKRLHYVPYVIKTKWKFYETFLKQLFLIYLLYDLLRFRSKTDNLFVQKGWLYSVLMTCMQLERRHKPNHRHR